MMKMEQGNLFSQMEQDAMESAPVVTSQTKLQALVKLVNEHRLLSKEIADLEDNLKFSNEKLRELAEKSIPDLFEELGVNSLTMDDGSKVEISSQYQAAITKANAEKAFGWLKDNGFEDIIKNDVNVKIKKGESEKLDQLRKELFNMELVFDEKQYVHPQTLKAFVNDQIKNGVNVPQDLFSLYLLRQAKIKG